MQRLQRGLLALRAAKERAWKARYSELATAKLTLTYSLLEVPAWDTL